ncbi:hypothetical protein ACX27_26830 [Nostoc piscinale CENA21]|uniref:Uncharacterized protein n=1 Tax=Nostoc piscinale CENA21 TaxID=224013 RepID=A0A0M4TXX0_9NOSO|nr:hypothetical protein [Nostoc piscinale]ALF55644.1 hypothetical protein ACX27_26830 [Nostoc piscinale CENA21]
MKVREAAEYLSIGSEQPITAKQLLLQVQAKFPALELTVDSELPEEFVQKVEEMAGKFQDRSTTSAASSTSAGGMGMATAANASEAITNIKSAALNITECIQQVLMEEEVVVAINRGFNDALTVLQAYESGKKQVLEAHASSRINALAEETNSILSEREALLMQRDSEERERLGKWSVQAHNSRTRLQRTREELAELLKLF